MFIKKAELVQAIQEILYIMGTSITSEGLWVFINCNKVIRRNIKHDLRNEGKYLNSNKTNR